MNSIEEIFKNIKSNLKYITNPDNTFELIISKIIDKLKDTGVVITNAGYEISDFKENFSKVMFKINVTYGTESKIENIFLIISNNEFNNELLKNYRKVIEIYLVNSLELDTYKYSVSAEEKITRKQLEYLNDQMKSRDVENIVKKALADFGIDGIEKLTKKNASAILDKIQSLRKRRY
ncbi:hypothetical protein I6E17_03575 [Fusobacterium perfoetens]|uniref:hypothetical protein n=1 Tax=Fusobacterium perfoetens TaxID=852 RepID=UPI001F324EC6|nr:hypothetical protein [Fusobacterium perfoetens]MCF2625260.1 hypothetical protein [Fusobacterium perfoetens]